MAIASLISRNTKQVLSANVQSNGNPTTIGTTPVVVYTCPTGKACLVTSYVTRFTGAGSNTGLFVNARGVRLRESTDPNEAAFEDARNGIRLAAGETITLSGDSGSNNGSAFFIFTGTELPA